MSTYSSKEVDSRAKNILTQVVDALKAQDIKATLSAKSGYSFSIEVEVNGEVHNNIGFRVEEGVSGPRFDRKANGKLEFVFRSQYFGDYALYKPRVNRYRPLDLNKRCQVHPACS